MLGLAAVELALTGEGAASTAATGLAAPELPLAAGITLARAVALARPARAMGPGGSSLPKAGPALPVALGVAAPAGGCSLRVRHRDPGDACRHHGRGPGHRARVRLPHMPPRRARLMERPGETMRAERVRGLRHNGPMGHGGGGVPGWRSAAPDP